MATAELLRSLRCRDVATASLFAYRSNFSVVEIELQLNNTVKSSLQGHHWVSLARPFSCIPVWNDVKGIDSVTTSSSVAEMEKKLGFLERKAHFEIRKHAEMVIWNIRMIKRYKTKIPGEIVKRIEDEVLDLRKASRGKSVFREPKSKMDENLARQNDSVVWGSHGDQFSSDDEQGGGYFGGEASWDQSGSDIPIMNKILEEYRDKIPSDLAREVEGAIIDLQKATEGGNVDEINAKLDDASRAVSKIGEHMYRGPDSGDFVGDHGPAGCLNDGEYHEGEASKNDPEALGGGSVSSDSSSRDGGFSQRLADAFGGGSNTDGGGFDSFDNHYDSWGGGD